MVYISKRNLSKLIQIKIVQCSPSWFEKKLKKLSFASKFQNFGLGLIIFSYIIILFFHPDSNWLCKFVLSLTLPLSFILFFCSDSNTENKEDKGLVKIFQAFFWNFFYSNFLALCFIEIVPDDISKIMLLCSVHTILYISAFIDIYKKSTHSSANQLRMTEINFLLVTFFILHLTLINTPFPFPSIASTLLTLYSTSQFLKIFTNILLTNNQSSLSKLAPILISNINLIFWLYIDLFHNFKTSIFLTHSILNILISFKLKVFTAAQEPINWSQIEILAETLFLLHESTINQIPTHPTYLIICIFIFLRCFSLYISLIKQLKTYFRLV